MAQVTSDALRVEVGLGSTWSTPLASVTWTDVTSSVLMSGGGVSFNRGKSSTDTVARPGTLSLTLDNSKQAGTEGRFTPGGANMLAGWGLRIPIRVRAKYPLGGASFVDLWYGFIESLDIAWDGGFRPTVKVSATDRLARLQRRSMQSLIVGEQLADGAVAVWPLDDAAGSLTAQDRSGNPSIGTLNYATYGTVTSSALLTFGSSTYLAPGPDGLTAANFSPQSTTVGRYLTTSNVGWWANANGYVPADGTVDFFVNPASSGTSRGLISYGPGADIWLDTANKINFSSPASGTLTGTTALTAGTWYHVAVTWVSSGSSGTITLYVNGSSEATFSGMNVGYRLNVLNVGLSVTAGTVANGSIANVAIYPTGLSAARIADRANARTSFLGETSAARFNRAARASGLGSAEYAVSGTTSALMSEQPFNGRNLFDIEAEVNDAEAGELYLSRSGVLTLLARSSTYNPASQFSLSASIIDASSDFIDDMQLIVNDVTVQRKGLTDGAEVRAVNSASVAAYDAHTQTLNVYVSTDAQATDAAAYFANTFAFPFPRLTDVTVDLVTAGATLGTSAVTAILSAEVGQMFQVTGLPAASTPATTMSLVLDGVSDSISDSSWKRTFVATSINASSASVWQLDSTTYSVLDSTTRLAF